MNMPEAEFKFSRFTAKRIEAIGIFINLQPAKIQTVGEAGSISRASFKFSAGAGNGDGANRN